METVFGCFGGNSAKFVTSTWGRCDGIERFHEDQYSSELLVQLSCKCWDYSCGTNGSQAWEAQHWRWHEQTWAPVLGSRFVRCCPKKGTQVFGIISRLGATVWAAGAECSDQKRKVRFFDWFSIDGTGTVTGSGGQWMEITIWSPKGTDSSVSSTSPCCSHLGLKVKLLAVQGPLRNSRSRESRI